VRPAHCSPWTRSRSSLYVAPGGAARNRSELQPLRQSHVLAYAHHHERSRQARCHRCHRCPRVRARLEGMDLRPRPHVTLCAPSTPSPSSRLPQSSAARSRTVRRHILAEGLPSSGAPGEHRTLSRADVEELAAEVYAAAPPCARPGLVLGDERRPGRDARGQPGQGWAARAFICDATVLPFGKGKIVVYGAGFPRGADIFAVTGGTGIYKGVRWPAQCLQPARGG
jgi:hypothetical protein